MLAPFDGEEAVKKSGQGAGAAREANEASAMEKRGVQLFWELFPCKDLGLGGVSALKRGFAVLGRELLEDCKAGDVVLITRGAKLRDQLPTK